MARDELGQLRSDVDALQREVAALQRTAGNMHGTIIALQNLLRLAGLETEPHPGRPPRGNGYAGIAERRGVRFGTRPGEDAETVSEQFWQVMDEEDGRLPFPHPPHGPAED